MERIGPSKPPRVYLREWADSKGLDQKALAGRMETTQATISRLLTGRMQLTLPWMAAFAMALGVEVSDLYRHPDTPSADELLRKIPSDKRQQAIDFLRFLATGTNG